MWSVCLNLFIVFPRIAAKTENNVPLVDVKTYVLQEFGIVDDVNTPGYLQILLSIRLSINSSNINWRESAASARATAMNQISSHTKYSAKNFSTEFIDNYRPFPEKHIAQFLLAHLLNLWNRLVATTSVFNESILWTLREFESGRIYGNCMDNQIVSLTAVHLMKELEPARACAEFETTLNQNTYNGFQPRMALRKLIRSVESSQDGITLVNSVVYDRSVPMARLYQSFSLHAVVPVEFKQLFIPTLRESFKDYAAFYESLSEAEKDMLGCVTGFPLPMIQAFLIDMTNALVIEERYKTNNC